LVTSSSQIDRERDEAGHSRDRVVKLPIPKAARAPRWRQIAPEEAAALCELFRTRDALVLDGDPATTWRFQITQRAPTSAVILRGVQDEAALSLIEDRFCERLGDRAWSDYEEKHQPLAWTLAHQFMLEGLGRVLGEPLWPRVLCEPAQPTAVAPNIVLAFSAGADDGRVIRGFVRLTPAMTSRLASHAGWRSSGDSFGRWATLPTPVRLVLPAVQFPLSELRETAVGDVLVLGQRAQCWGALQLRRLAPRTNAPLGAWSATYDGTRITVSNVAPIYEAETIMSQSTPEAPQQANSSDVLPRIAVTLEFDLGSVTLPLGEVAALKPGYVFQLPGRLEDARVVIRAAGVRVGHGELVAVGDVLGVQVLALETDGLR
jgi:type III secretion protein Q